MSCNNTKWLSTSLNSLIKVGRQPFYPYKSRGFKVKKTINNRDRQDKKDKVKIFGVWRNYSCLVLMVLSYTSCISLFKKRLRPYGYCGSEVDNQIKI